MKKAFVEEKECVACGTCLVTCPRQAIHIAHGCYAVIYSVRCVGLHPCCICVSVCCIFCLPGWDSFVFWYRCCWLLEKEKRATVIITAAGDSLCSVWEIGFLHSEPVLDG